MPIFRNIPPHPIVPWYYPLPVWVEFLAVGGSGAVTLGNTAGASTNTDVHASGAITLGSLTAAGVAKLTTIAVGKTPNTLGALSVAATETFVTYARSGYNSSHQIIDGGRFNGALFPPQTITLGNTAGAGVSLDVHATGAIILGVIAGSGSATQVLGTGTITLQTYTQAGTGKFTTVGSSPTTITLGALVVGCVASAACVGTGSLTLGSLTVAGVGATLDVGTGSITLGNTAGAGVGVMTAVAAPTITLGGLVVVATPAFEDDATGALTLAGLVVAGAGIAGSAGVVSGAGALILGPLTIANTETFTASATGAITLGPLVEASAVNFTASGAGTITLARLIVSATEAFNTAAHGGITLGPLVVAGFATSVGGSPALLSYIYPKDCQLLAIEDASPFAVDPRSTVNIS